MSSSAVASRYAKALFAIGVEQGNLSSLVRELGEFSETYKASQELRSVLENPLASIEAKKAIVSDIVKAMGASDMLSNALKLLVERQRIENVSEIALALNTFSDAQNGTLRAEVISAEPLSEAYADALRIKLEKITGKKMTLDKRVDPSLIAGVIARVGDKVYDGSLRARLEQMKLSLLPN